MAIKVLDMITNSVVGEGSGNNYACMRDSLWLFGKDDG